MTAHIPMLLTLASILLLTITTVACALAIAVAQGALVSRVRIDADVTIIPAPRRVITRVTPSYSPRTSMVLLNRAFDSMLVEVDTRIQAYVLAQRFQERRFAS